MNQKSKRVYAVTVAMVVGIIGAIVGLLGCGMTYYTIYRTNRDLIGENTYKMVCERSTSANDVTFKTNKYYGDLKVGLTQKTGSTDGKALYSLYYKQTNSSNYKKKADKIQFRKNNLRKRYNVMNKCSGKYTYNIRVRKYKDYGRKSMLYVDIVYA